MRKSSGLFRKSGHPVGKRLASLFFGPALAGLALFLIFPSSSAHSDLATFLSGINRGGESWRGYMTLSPAGSIHEVEMVFNDPITTGAIADGAGITLPGGGQAALVAGTKQPDALPDEDRVNRSGKKGRIVTVVPMLPPKDFSAGSVLDRTSSLMLPRFASKQHMAFVKPNIKGKEIAIATAFYNKKEPQPDARIPTELASLVTNRIPDILATAYARPEPDYARVSPFDSILKTEKEPGRFVPAIEAGDHAWAASILPADVFSANEQKCLAEGIYFESRGEPLKGQAAVAQVILNRVRNPAYPGSICGVVYQNKQWRNRCQFSFACDNIRDRIFAKSDWKMAYEVALAVTAGKIWLNEVGSATHYHATYVRPNWARTMKRVGRIGLHIFYRTYGGGWT